MATAKKKSNKSNDIIKSSNNRANKLNIISAFSSLLLALLAGLTMKDSSYQLFSGLIAKDELASKTNTVFVPAIHAVYDIQLRWIVVGIMLTAAIMPLVNIYINYKNPKSAKSSKIEYLQRIHMAIIGALSLETIALISGVRDITTLKIIAGLVVIACLLGQIAENQFSLSGKKLSSPYILSIIAGILPLLVIICFAIGTPLYGMVRSPWYVYALYGSTVLTLSAYAINQYLYFSKYKMWANYKVVQQNYIVISTIANAMFGIILIAGLYR